MVRTTASKVQNYSARNTSFPNSVHPIDSTNTFVLTYTDVST